MPVALDIGGSGVRAAALGPDGLPLEIVRAPLAREWNLEELTAAILGCARAAAAGSKVDVAVAAIPGFLDAEGRLLAMQNLPALEGFDLAGCLSQALDCRWAAAIPDLGATVLAEARCGAGVGYHRVLATAIGTGVNAGLAVDGQLQDIALGALGDAGHVNVEPDGEPCPCGGRGCLESVCAGAALDAAARRQGWSGATEITQRLQAGDASAKGIVDRAGKALGRAIASWGAILALDVVTVGGGVALLGAPLLSSAVEEMHRVGSPAWLGALQVVPARFHADAALIGAGLAAHEEALRRQSEFVP